MSFLDRAESRLSENRTPASSFARREAVLVDTLSRGDPEQQSPQAITIGEVRKTSLAGTAAETVEGAGRDVLLVHHPLPAGGETRAGELGHPLEELFSQQSNRLVVAIAHAIDLTRHRSLVRHRLPL